ncbi:MAG: hypothetical protein ACREJ5_07445 [Geminicoccaceae bacterium]
MTRGRVTQGRVTQGRVTQGRVTQGRVTRHHRFLLALHLKQIDALDVALAAIGSEVKAELAPTRRLIVRLGRLGDAVDIKPLAG